MSAADFARLLEGFSAQFAGLPDKPRETAQSSLRVLWHLASGQPVSVEAAHGAELTGLDAAGLVRLEQLVAQRLGGTPLAHLSGRQRFMGLDMLAGPQALIARAETELLAQAAIHLVRGWGAQPVRVVDVCTGSGNVALAIAHYVQSSKVFAADISADALDLARRNAFHLGLEGRVEWRCGDLLAPFEGAEFVLGVDVMVCNPPYISSSKVEQMPLEIRGHEPRLAFDGGALGISVLNRLLRDAPRFLKAGGWLVVEVGWGQAEAVAKRLRSGGGFEVVESLADADGALRVVRARRGAV
jgi:release factor glutamine methyltransferase